MLDSGSPLVRLVLFSLFLVTGVFSGGCSSQREAVLSKLELDRLFHRVDVAADRAEQEREAQERMATSYWGMQSSTLEREIARPDPTSATSSDDLMQSRPGATPIEMAPIAGTAPPPAESGSATAASSPSQRLQPAEVQMPSAPPPPKLAELPVPPRPSTAGVERVKASPAVQEIVPAGENGSNDRTSGPAGKTEGGAGVMQPSYYGVATDPAELLESGKMPVDSGDEVAVAPGAKEDISLFRPAFGSMSIVGEQKEAAPGDGSAGLEPAPSPETSSGANAAKTVPENVAVSTPMDGETEDWASLISSIRPFSSRAPVDESPLTE